MRSNPIKIQDIQQRQQRINSMPNGINNVAVTEATLETNVSGQTRDDMVRRLFSLCKDTETAEETTTTEEKE